MHRVENNVPISAEGRPKLDTILRALSAAYIPTAAALLVAWIVDDRTYLGESVWAKPFKFAVSIGLSGASTLWLLRRLPRTRIATVGAWLVAGGLAVEQVLITMQGARGTGSHFNVANGFDANVYSAMGAIVSLVWIGLLMLTIIGARRPPRDPLTRAVVVGGSWLVLLGSSVGFALVANDGHSIGGKDGGPGMAITGWNSQFGDLRPAHFIGLHSLQALIAIAALAPRITSTMRQAALAWGTCAALAVATIGSLIQGYAGEPITSASTLGIAFVAIGAAAAAVGTRRGEAD
jgi:hypothetical protein